MDMQLIGESTPLKFSALCIGGCFTMDCQDAIRAANLLKCQQIIGIHHNTFPPIKTDCALASMQFQAAGKVLHLLPIGESVSF
jgi:L-ascorbate metabolism protein UlaG (beta-lactamase superfamily)